MFYTEKIAVLAFIAGSIFLLYLMNLALLAHVVWPVSTFLKQFTWNVPASCIKVFHMDTLSIRHLENIKYT